MPLLYPMGFLKAAAGGPASISFAAAAVDTSNATTYTFTGHGIGTASSDRYVIVPVATRGKNVTSVTVGGASCTQVVTVNNASDVYSYIFITDAPFTSGTTANIVVNTGPGGATSCGIGTFAATGLVSNTATATNTQTTDNTSTSLAVTADGIAVAHAFVQQGSPGSTFSTTGITERYDADVETLSERHTGCSANQASTTTINITIDNNGSSIVFAGTYAAFR